ncbi:MAG TPA: phage tail protein [Rheinheimera sp.]|nr:phage tail protein [Rheinheimera sp.]
MSILAQGTQVWFIDPTGSTLTEIPDVTSFSPAGAPADQIETTPLSSQARTYKKGLRTPGQATLGINADPAIPAHIRLFDLSKDNTNTTIKFAVGWSDGTTAPTVTGGNFTLPTTRTWFTFEGYIADFPLDFAANGLVTTSCAVQRSGDATWTKKA